MHEVAYVDERIGPVRVAFDGRVVEVFTTRQPDSVRVHVSQLDIKVGGPDRKGRYDLNLRGVLQVPGEVWPRMEALLAQIRAAQVD